MGNIKMLLIEDLNADVNAINSALATTCFHNKTHLIRARRLEEALHILEDNEIDLILLDLSISDSICVDNISILNNKFPTVPIVVISDLSDKSIMRKALKNGAKSFLVKSDCSALCMQNQIIKLLPEEVSNLIAHEY